MINNVREYIIQKAEEFGAKTDNPFNRSYVERNNTKADALKDNGAYFGFIHPDEEVAGPFHDFSYTIFPNDDDKPWLICLGIGSNGFKNDYELSTYPGLRRLFSKLVDENGFCKSDFSDIESSLPKNIVSHPNLQHIKNTIKTYSKVLPVCQIVDDPMSDSGKKIIDGFLAGYAKLRDWASNASHRKAISESISHFELKEKIDDFTEISELLNERKYVILQGPPGTGKTRLAKEISDKFHAKLFFTQFHAETTYSDFIYGLRPAIHSDNISYEEINGVFTRAIQHAIDTKEKTILIIDEINRANLSNVLGPIFYLFEHKQDISNVEIEITPKLHIDKLPDNFFVIATMNTADRSLAVVDFALRRRFAWYDLKPQKIKIKEFYKKYFEEISEIFNWYATTEELNLQPGQGYFIASSDEEMQKRLQYELLPLIKEYLEEGLLLPAKEEFNNFFMTNIKRSIFE